VNEINEDDLMPKSLAEVRPGRFRYGLYAAALPVLLGAAAVLMVGLTLQEKEDRLDQEEKEFVAYKADTAKELAEKRTELQEKDTQLKAKEAALEQEAAARKSAEDDRHELETELVVAMRSDRGRPGRAVREVVRSVEPAIARPPPPPSATKRERARGLWQEGYAAYRDGRVDDAVAAYEKAKRIDPTYAAPYNSLGRIESERGNKEKARDLYLAALEQRPDYVPALNNLGWYYLTARDIERARKYAEQALQHQPGYPGSKRLLDKLDAM